MRKITKVVSEIVFMTRFARTPSLEHDPLSTLSNFSGISENLNNYIF